MNGEMPLPPTPGQTVGPFFGYALPYAGDNELVPPTHPGAIRLYGRVLDGADDPVPDALVEIWQTDADGRVPRVGGSLRRDGWTFTGWGRAATDNTGTYTFSTVHPGSAGSGRPFFAVTVVARGLLNRLFTRAYLPTSTESTDADRFLSTVAPERRRTLITTSEEDGLRFDIRLQGPDETVFLRFPDDRA